MLSQQTLQRYRNMTTGERGALVLQAMAESWPAMFEGRSEVVDRRFLLLRKQNDERNQSMLEGIARTRRRES